MEPMTTNTTNSQAASIDTREFRLLLADLCEASEFGPDEYGKARDPFIAHIDAKLAQAREEVANHQQSHIDQLKARLAGLEDICDGIVKQRDAAESRLAEIQRKLSEVPAYWLSADGGPSQVFYSRLSILALLQPQGQASESKT